MQQELFEYFMKHDKKMFCLMIILKLYLKQNLKEESNSNFKC